MITKEELNSRPRRENGIYYDISNEDYHSHFALSKSQLDNIHDSPYNFISSIGNFRAPTKAMEFGTAVHASILEPDLFEETYVTYEGSTRTKAGKEAMAELEASGKKVLSKNDYEAIQAIQMSAGKHKILSALLKDGVGESSVFSKFPVWSEHTGGFEYVDVRCRPDWYTEKFNTIVDVKTTSAANKKEFQRIIAKFRYHVAHAFYHDVCKNEMGKDNRFILAAIVTKPPYEVVLYELDGEAAEQGREEYNDDLQTYLECVRTWKWRSDRIVSMSLPRWAVRS